VRILQYLSLSFERSETFTYGWIPELERQEVDNHVVTLLRKNPERQPFPKVNVANGPDQWSPHREANSRGNQYPIVLVEEQAVGLPCVSPRRAGIPEMIPAVLPHPRWRPNVAQKLGVKMVQSLYVRIHV